MELPGATGPAIFQKNIQPLSIITSGISITTGTNRISIHFIEEVLKFWFDDLSPDDWFESDEAVDSHIRERFQELHETLREQVPETWRSSARGCLAAVIVLDQFSRNMYRGTSRAFAADGAALSLAKEALVRGFDRELSIDERKFLYMPFEHSENPAEQERSIELFGTLESELDLDYARRHKEIIDRFGRFPHRNAVLGRISTPEEIEFIKEPGSSF